MQIVKANPISSSEIILGDTVCLSVFVLILQSISGPYCYSVPCGMRVELGSIVRVPLRSRSVLGIVWYSSNNVIDNCKLRPIEYIFECDPISHKMCEFIQWVSKYTFSSTGLVARMVVSSLSLIEKIEEKIQFTGIYPKIKTAARLRVINEIKDGSIWGIKDLISAAKVSPKVIDGLKNHGIIKKVTVIPLQFSEKPDPNFSFPILNIMQKEAVDHIIPLCRDVFSVSLIDGVTGSGKTEVYLEVIAEVLRSGKQVLILLPEISLVASIVERFKNRFGTSPAEWSSSLSLSVREKIYRNIAKGTISAVVGVRSALFLPFKRLGIIVVDEEHDISYKQEDRILYNARDMSVVRGKIEKFPIVLVSATPSIESKVNCMRGRYHLLHLPIRRFNSVLPDLRLVDMRNQSLGYGKFISLELRESINDTLKRNEQALLFLNRRGYAPLTLCKSCGYRLKCPHCSCWLVEHRSRKKLSCHQCGYMANYPEYCVKCGSADHMIACGPGVERIAEEVLSFFPAARISILSSDLDGGMEKIRLQMEDITRGKFDVIIGTQLIAKGHNFPRISLVGVIDGDLSLANADLRASEKTYQLLSQVTGRAGRFGLKSLGLIQTYYPMNPIMQALISGDANSFYETEIKARKELFLPPFGRLSAVIVSGKVYNEAERYAYNMKKNAPINSDISVFGPAEAPLLMVRGRYRFRLLIHAKNKANSQKFIADMCAKSPKKNNSLRVQVDIDPQSFF
ncbi:primosomal protein N' [Candidatus Liberibacter americanus]|uniref:Replication restart protein PriA n=1 Tax=Candidatus Liberibacter americanus str. Sao Paulo TaxID=1261131 RepID=U6B9G9_9HYPH|nr:Primosomal protein N' [Candidatus Liberibacter americanus str. Sao Paulo]EMS36656.1 primosome assembly protein PriA [Candidatus Liberibacter americanus PW_SP]